MTRMLTIADVAERLNCHDGLVRRLIGSGKLPASKVGGQWRIDPPDLEAFIQGTRTVRATDPTSDSLPPIAVRRFA